MSSIDPPPLTTEERRGLLRVARESIAHGVEYGYPLTVDPFQFSTPLQAPRATFVTLKRNGNLRGCIGALQASRSLVQDVAHNAYAAAFQDPRFPRLAAEEYPELDIHIAVLGDPEPLAAHDERELAQRLRPGKDGVILEEGQRRATFLPAVWKQIADPVAFLRELKQKAGLAPDYWSDTLKAYRYTAESFPEE